MAAHRLPLSSLPTVMPTQPPEVPVVHRVFNTDKTWEYLESEALEECAWGAVAIQSVHSFKPLCNKILLLVVCMFSFEASFIALILYFLILLLPKAH